MRKQDLKQSPSFPVASPASPSPPRENGRVLRMNATCGRRCAELLPNCGPVGCLGKMLLASSIWGSTKRFLTWQKRDTLFSHSYFRLAASAHGMSASELLSSRLMFPTPLASDKSTCRDAANLDVFLSDNGISEEEQGRIHLEPVPVGGGVTPDPGGVGGLPLHPETGGLPGEIPGGQPVGESLHQEKPLSEKAALNPDWVEWLMGFPQGWTAVLGRRAGGRPPDHRGHERPGPAAENPGQRGLPAPGLSHFSLYRGD